MDMAAEGGGGLGDCGSTDRLREKSEREGAVGVGRERCCVSGAGARSEWQRTGPARGAVFITALGRGFPLPLPSRRRSAPANGEGWAGLGRGCPGAVLSPIFPNGD